MSDERKPARLDFTGFKPKTAAPPVDPVTLHRSIEEGKRMGFTARDDTPPIDGRTLRRKGKVQLNMKVSPAVQREFRRAVSDFPDADACLQHLLTLYQQSRS